MSGYRDTRWGKACVAIWTRMLIEVPSLQLNVGPDDGAKIGAPPLLTFQHAGETPVPALRGGSGDGGRNPWDRPTLLSVEIWGSTPAEAESIYEELLLALDAVAHGRAGKLGAFKPQIGSESSGNLGAKMIGSITLRLPVSRGRRTARATTHGVGVEADAPAESPGQGEEVTLV